MKANAPEKLYISDSELNDSEHCIIWFKSQQNKNDIEYTRTDAFIKKVINFLNYKLDDVVATRVAGTIIPHHVAKQEVIEDFIKYMEE